MEQNISYFMHTNAQNCQGFNHKYPLAQHKLENNRVNRINRVNSINIELYDFRMWVGHEDKQFLSHESCVALMINWNWEQMLESAISS